MTTASKAALRAELRAARDGFVLDLGPAARTRLEACAADHLMPLLDGGQCIAFYHARGGELDCASAIAATRAPGIAIALPHVIDADQPMRFLAWQPGDPLEPGWRGLIQPRADAPETMPDIIVAPLLGFDSDGWQLGQGGGFYDRVFAERPGVRKIALGWSIQQRPAIAHDPWDVPLDAVVTERGVIEKEADVMIEPSWRKPAGIFLILLIILVWAVIVSTAASWVGKLPALVQGVFYIVAGLVWILPLKPLLAWMETGKWRP